MEALVQLLPIAIALALSSVPITVTLAILSSQSSRSAVPFLAGWILGITCITTFFVIVARAFPTPTLREPKHWVAVLEILIGITLIALAVIGHVRRSRMGRSREDQNHSAPPRWLNRAGSMGPLAAFAVGVVLNLRPKALLLGAAAGLAFNGPRLDTGEIVLLIAVYVAVASSTIIVPILGTLFAPQIFQPRLTRSKAWMIANGDLVTTITLLIVGVFIAGHGLADL